MTEETTQPKEKKEQPKITCKYCGEEKTKAHEHFCSANPNNPRTKKKEMAMKPAPVLNQDTPSTSEPVEPPILISDVQPYLYDDVAWFEVPGGKLAKHIGNIGIYHTDDGQKIPVVLVLTESGHLLPPFMMDGFLGMFPEGQTFTDTQQDDTEPFPPFPEEVEEQTKPEVIPEVLDNNTDLKTEPPKEKKSWWPFSHSKEKAIISHDVEDVIKEAIDATG